MMQPHPSILGGSAWNDDHAGSRYANLDNWPENSDENLGARPRRSRPTPAPPLLEAAE